MDGVALPSAEWILTIIQASINVKAVVFAILGTQALKRFLPTPPAPNGHPLEWWEKFAVKEGPIISRVIPFLPVLMAFAMTYFFERDSHYTLEDAFRGVVSGAFAGWTFSTTKIQIFGVKA